MKNFFNKFTNNNRIFSYQDVINMPNDEGAFFKDAIDYQARTIGLPTNEQLQMSSDVVYVHAYTRDDGTKVRAHYRSKAGHAFANPNKPNIQTAQDAKKHIENWAGKVMGDNGQITGAAVNWNEILGKAIETNFGEKAQAKVAKHPIITKVIKNDTPISNEYYRIAVTNGESIYKTDTQNYKFQIKDLVKDSNLYNHILGMSGNRKIQPDDMLIIPKQNSNLTSCVKYSTPLIDKIKANKNAIMRNEFINNSIPNVNFYKTADLATTLGTAHIYNPQINHKGELNLLVVDWYDFDKKDKITKNNAINNNAFKQQQDGRLANYALVIRIKYSKEELKEIFE